ncbi:hypothetical protein B4N89_45020 [Embleya scabrispora]|uniref:Uncharacterized protein n=1 Tax=Embleya scabrispora TaxID=159449 RepID=A0A1T3NIV0_9ACTN|nr:hypothetical protein [Embleya scabrispora]OPC76655.1 hypothetical protein B4N89_45020 [Embleya scabrispora]
MVFVTYANSHGGMSPPTPPRKGDGSHYRFELVHEQGLLRTYGDDGVDLVAGVIHPFLRGSGPRAEAAARIRVAVRTQVVLQASLAMGIEMESCNAEQRSVLLGSRAYPPTVRMWDAPVPLVLVTSFYRPTGMLTTPRGNILWLDPTTGESLLSSLLAANVVVLAERSG